MKFVRLLSLVFLLAINAGASLTAMEGLEGEEEPQKTTEGTSSGETAEKWKKFREERSKKESESGLDVRHKYLILEGKPSKEQEQLFQNLIQEGEQNFLPIALFLQAYYDPKKPLSEYPTATISWNLQYPLAYLLDFKYGLAQQFIKPTISISINDLTSLIESEDFLIQDALNVIAVLRNNIATAHEKINIFESTYLKSPTAWIKLIASKFGWRGSAQTPYSLVNFEKIDFPTKEQEKWVRILQNYIHTHAKQFYKPAIVLSSINTNQRITSVVYASQSTEKSSTKEKPWELEDPEPSVIEFMLNMGMAAYEIQFAEGLIKRSKLNYAQLLDLVQKATQAAREHVAAAQELLDDEIIPILQDNLAGKSTERETVAVRITPETQQTGKEKTEKKEEGKPIPGGGVWGTEEEEEELTRQESTQQKEKEESARKTQEATPIRERYDPVKEAVKEYGKKQEAKEQAKREEKGKQKEEEEEEREQQVAATKAKTEQAIKEAYAERKQKEQKFLAEQQQFLAAQQQKLQEQQARLQKSKQERRKRLGKTSKEKGKIHEEPIIIKKIAVFLEDNPNPTTQDMLRWIREKAGLNEHQFNPASFSYNHYIQADGTLFAGTRKVENEFELEINNFYNKYFSKKTDDWEFYRDKLVDLYKIHLQPKNRADLMYIMYILLESLKMNEDERNLIFLVKVADKQLMDQIFDSKFTLKNRNYLPLIVIYPAIGKAQAQKCLNLMCSLFGNMAGLTNKSPRFNQHVVGPVYYAQGDGTYKDDSNNFHEYFSTKDRIHYNPEKIGFEDKSEEDFHLNLEEARAAAKS